MPSFTVSESKLSTCSHFTAILDAQLQSRSFGLLKMTKGNARVGRKMGEGLFTVSDRVPLYLQRQDKTYRITNDPALQYVFHILGPCP
jgi:hypothetical protein